MKKKIIALIFIISVFTSFCSAQIVSFFTPKVPEFSVKASLEIPLEKDFRMDSFGGNAVLSMELNQVDADLGIRFSDGEFDLTSSLSYAPVFFEMFDVGICGTTHLYTLEDHFTELDGILNASFDWLSVEHWKFNLTAGYLFKRSIVYAVAAYRPFIENNTPVLSASVYFTLNRYFSASFRWTSFTYYDYPVFGTPFMIFNVESSPIDRLSLGIDYTLEFKDMYSVSSHLTRMDMHLYAKVTL